jgi:hypothetical protein
MSGGEAAMCFCTTRRTAGSLLDTLLMLLRSLLPVRLNRINLAHARNIPQRVRHRQLRRKIGVSEDSPSVNSCTAHFGIILASQLSSFLDISDV